VAELMQFQAPKDYRVDDAARLREDLQRQRQAIDNALRELDRDKADRWRWRRVASTSATADFGEALLLDVTVGAIVVRLPDGDIQRQGRRVLLCLSASGTVTVRPITGTINGANSDSLTAVGSYIYEWDGAAWWRSSAGAWAPAPLPDAGTLSKFDTSTSPVALYNFEGNWNDDSGNGLHLTRTGNSRFVNFCPDTRPPSSPFIGHMFDGNTFGTHASNAALQLHDDLTIEIISWMYGPIPSPGVWVEYGGGNVPSTGNPLYSVIHQQVGEVTNLIWFTESGSSTAASYSLPWHPIVGKLQYLAITKVRSGSNCEVKFYANGTLIGTSPTLVNPTDGSASFLRVGNNDLNNARMNNSAIFSLRISPVARSAADIKAEYNARLGGYYGVLP
jgi:hypothetical protein